jgi:plasmid stabilization system protein ParE
MNIDWSDFAKNQLKEIFEYYKKYSNVTIAKNIVKKITNSVKVLIINSELGQIEYYINHTKTFRYILEGHFK